MGRIHIITTHHRLPSSRGGTNCKYNISFVRDNQHEAWHTLFGNLEVWDIAKLINEVWIDPNFEFIVRPRF